MMVEVQCCAMTFRVSEKVEVRIINVHKIKNINIIKKKTRSCHKRKNKDDAETKTQRSDGDNVSISQIHNTALLQFEMHQDQRIIHRR